MRWNACLLGCFIWISNAPAGSLSLNPGTAADGVVNLTARGAAGDQLVVETTTDLRNWAPFQSLVLASENQALAVPTGEAGFRFYRLRTANAGETPAPLAISTILNADLHRTAIAGRDLPVFISVQDTNGVLYELNMPAGVLLASEEVALDVVGSATDWPLGGGFLGGVKLSPEGLRLLGGATLSITVPTHSAPPAMGVAWHAAGAEFHATPAIITSEKAVFPLGRLGGYGVAAGMAADRTLLGKHPPTSFEEQGNQELALSVLPAAAGVPHRSGAGPAGEAPKGVALSLGKYRQRVRPRLIDAAGDDAALEPALYDYAMWHLSSEMIFPKDQAYYQAAFSEGNQLAIAAIEATLARASKRCDRHDLRSLARMVRAGQLFEAPPWAAEVNAIERDAFRQMVKNCATFDLDLDGIVDSVSQAGRQHSRVHTHWTIDFKDEALTQLTGSGPVPISEVDYVSSTVCAITWNPAGGYAQIPEFSLGVNFRDTAALAQPPSAAAMKVGFNPFLTPPSEGYQAVCAGFQVGLGDYWTVAFGAAYKALIVKMPLGQVLELQGWSPGGDDLLGSLDGVFNSLQAQGFTSLVAVHWQLHHVPVSF